MRTAGVVLCGGLSSRMGAPKAWLPFGDELMLPRVVRVVGEAVGAVVVVAAPGQAVPPLPADVRVVRDEVEGRGPLGGLAAGLAALEGQADAVYLSSCDAPLLTAAFVRRVAEFLLLPSPLAGEGGGASPPGEGALRSAVPQSSSDARGSPLTRLEDSPPSPARGEGQEKAAAPFVHGRLHPLAAAYALAVRPVVRDMLAANCFRMTDLLDRVAARRIAAHELPDLDSLRNANTPDEYAAALRALRTS